MLCPLFKEASKSPLCCLCTVFRLLNSCWVIFRCYYSNKMSITSNKLGFKLQKVTQSSFIQSYCVRAADCSIHSIVLAKSWPSAHRRCHSSFTAASALNGFESGRWAEWVCANALIFGCWNTAAERPGPVEVPWWRWRHWHTPTQEHVTVKNAETQLSALMDRIPHQHVGTMWCCQCGSVGDLRKTVSQGHRGGLLAQTNSALWCNERSYCVNRGLCYISEQYPSYFS